MFEQYGRLPCLEPESIECVLESFYRLRGMVRDTDEVHPIERDLSIIQDSNPCSTECSENIIRMLIFFMVPIREDNTMRSHNFLKFLSHSEIVNPWSIIEVSWNDDNITREHINLFHELLSVPLSINIPIVCIRDHDNRFSMPCVRCCYIHMISLYPWCEAQIECIAIESRDKYHKEDDISPMIIGEFSDIRYEEKGTPHHPSQCQSPNPVGSDLVKEGKCSIWESIRTDDSDDKTERSEK